MHTTCLTNALKRRYHSYYKPSSQSVGS
jgi:hypothetical protein